MNSLLKGALHTLATTLMLALPLFHGGWFDLTVGAVLTICLNWIISHTIPTTTGASAKQN